jgi:cyclopropane fatty-acyl-phospholipid synthase-like methyltransferase
MTDPRDPDRPDAAAGAARHAPAAQRNKQPILEVLRRLLPGRGTVLELAAGTGEHAVWFARHLPDLTWQPSDADAQMRASIDAHAGQAGAANLRPALALDVTAAAWPLDRADAALAVNLIHIAPWAAAEGLFAGAVRVLPAGAPLVLYGPFRRGGRHTAESNARFDAFLRAQDPRWGVRDLDDVDALAARCGFDPLELVEMPANNFVMAYRRRA